MALGDVLPDGTIQCAWHGARFDCATGAVRQGPATDPLPVFEVRLEGNEVLIGPLAPRAGAGHEPCAAALAGENQ
jgi:nitrite reductase/ring-hydroxylating ferredoxin subunit